MVCNQKQKRNASFTKPSLVSNNFPQQTKPGKMSFRMHIGVPGKKYGLQLSQQVDDEPAETFEEALAKDAARKKSSKKITNIYENALQEDPTAFDYDGVYDQIHEQRKSEQDKKKEEAQKRQPRYIHAILEKTKERKREQDVIYDRKLQREKDAEGNLFGDKEKFITAAYKKKLIEQKKWLEEEAKREEEERKQDVTKKADLSDFYANLLTNNVALGTTQQKQPTKTAPTPSQPPTQISTAIPQSANKSHSTALDSTKKAEGQSVPIVDNKKQEEPTTESDGRNKRKADDKPADDKTEEQQKEQKITRRNDEKAISEAKMRYLMRKAAKEAEPKPNS